MVAAVLMLVSSVMQGAGATENWPAVVAFHRTYRFSGLGAGIDTPVVEIIRDSAGVPRYQLECHSGAYERDSPITFSGTHHCAVFGIRGTATLDTPNLLAEDTRDGQSSDWFNRGRFRAGQLMEPCASYAEYGPTRTFRFRRMAVTLRVSSIVWSKTTTPATYPTAFVFDVDVRADPTATTSHASRPAVRAPPDECYP